MEEIEIGIIAQKFLNKILCFSKNKIAIFLAFSFLLLFPILLGKIQVVKGQSEIEPIELSGMRQQATQKFTLRKGLAIFRMIHSGQSNFSIWLLYSNGEKVELLVNEIGSFDGAKAVGINREGEYILDISADGKWIIKIEQLSPSSGPSVPQNLTGKGQQVSEMFSMGKGLATFKMTHNGSSNFAIWLLDERGQKVELLVNEIGVFDGSKAVRIRNGGVFILDIAADGDWSVSIEGETFEPPQKQVKETKDKEKEQEDSDKKGCFIATAVYDIPTAPEVNTLREFRNDILLKSNLGREFVGFYYQNSPPIAEFISTHPLIKRVVREVGINPVVEFLMYTRNIWNP